jgi:hypothetical protein
VITQAVAIALVVLASLFTAGCSALSPVAAHTGEASP